LLEKIKIGQKTAFEEVFAEVENRIHAIFVFLSVLELIQEQQIKITIGDGYNNFWVEKNDPEEIKEVVLEGQQN
jgi:segregation and condensation protein A